MELVKQRKHDIIIDIYYEVIKKTKLVLKFYHWYYIQNEALEEIVEFYELLIPYHDAFSLFCCININPIAYIYLSLNVFFNICWSVSDTK